MTGAASTPTSPANGRAPHPEPETRGETEQRVHVPRPIFVIGSLRSGATLLALCLGQHPNIRPVPDATWIEQFAAGLDGAYQDDMARGDMSQLTALGIDLDRFYAQFGAAIDHLMLGDRTESASRPADPAANHDPQGWQAFGRLDQHQRDARTYRPRRWVDGAYTHSFIVATLIRLFPEARFIHVVRDVAQVVAALTDPANAAAYKSRHIAFTPRDAYEHWIDCVSACVAAERFLGSRMVLRVRQRDLLASPEVTIRRCLRFLNEPLDQWCLRPFQGLRVPAAATGSSAPQDDVPVDVLQQATTLSFALLEDGNPTEPRAGTRDRHHGPW